MEGIVKRLLSLLVVLFALTGCIISKTPKTNSVTTLPGTDVTFSVTIFPSAASFVWTLDDTPLADATKSYKYTPTHGQHTLTVTAKHSLGTDTWTWNILDAEAAVPINSSGGTVAVTSSSSPLAGTQVTIPVNALIINATITISQTDAPSGLPGQSAGPCVDFGPNGTQFSSPVEIALPYLDEDNNGIVDGTDIPEDQVKVWYFNETTQAWENIPIVSQDTDLNFVYISLTHFSEYVTSVQAKSWYKTFGGSSDDGAIGVHQTNDGGYVFTGYTKSSGTGDYDAWLVKTDADGNELWQKTFGGPEGDEGISVQQTNDGGYIIGGDTSSFGTGGRNAWLIKTDADGNEQWSKTFVSSDDVDLMSVQQTTDDGFFLSGTEAEFNKLLLIKTDKNGNLEWLENFELPSSDSFMASLGGQQMNDGSYVVAAPLASDNKTYLIKIDANGAKLWDKIFTKGYAIVLHKTSDSGLILAGLTIQLLSNKYYPYLEKIDADGNEQWNRTYSDTGEGIASGVDQTNDGGYALVGTDLIHGTGTLLIKTNENGIVQWNKTFPSKSNEELPFIQQTSDGGYILSGVFDNVQLDALLIKTDSLGNVNVP
jgi:hypothetical protein